VLKEGGVEHSPGWPHVPVSLQAANTLPGNHRTLSQRTRCTARHAGTCSINLFHHLVGISENSAEIVIFKVLISREPVPDLILVINHALPQDESNWNVVDVLIENKKG
jgi:hypothetical protein